MMVIRSKNVLGKLRLVPGLFFLFLVSTKLNALVVCSGQDRTELITRDQIATGGGSGVDRQFDLFGTVTGAASFITPVDLNISVDVNSLMHGMTSVTTDWVWSVTAVPLDFLTGYIIAEYQFNGLVPGDNKICSSPSSCIQASNLTSNILSIVRVGLNQSNPNAAILTATGGLSFDLNLEGASDSGTYVGALEITLSNGPNIDGTGSSSLSCDLIL